MIWPASDIQQQITIDRFYSFFEVHRDKGFHFPGETHNFWECVYILDGSIVVSGDERVYTLEKGEIIFHKPMELHKYFVESAKGADLLIFSFSMDGPLVNTLKNKVFSLSTAQQNLVSMLLNYARDHLDPSADTADDMMEHRYLRAFDRLPTYSQTMVAYLYLLLLSLVGDGEVAEVSTAPDAQIFRKAVNYLNHHISERPTISELAGHCNTSNATLKRIFSRFAGIGIHKYFMKLKIQAASRLLKEGNSVTETAEKLGFSSQAYFSAMYKRETGMNPSEIK